jgi:hypothetical protein
MRSRSARRLRLVDLVMSPICEKRKAAMRIAVSGTHNTGKSTLVAELGERLPGHLTLPEPYEQLEDEGHAFALPPPVDDYVIQLRQSIHNLESPAANLIVDRCPLDFIAYIAASRNRVWFDPGPLLEPVRRAMSSLDLVIVVRIDRAHDPDMENDRLRRDVDGRLADLVADDEFDLLADNDVLELAGPWDRRVETVLAHLSTRRGTPS